MLYDDSFMCRHKISIRHVINSNRNKRHVMYYPYLFCGVTKIPCSISIKISIDNGQLDTNSKHLACLQWKDAIHPECI